MYDTLHLWLRRRHITQRDLARQLGLSAACVSSRMRGHTAWQLHEAIRTLDVLDLPIDMIPEVFGDVHDVAMQKEV